MEQKVSTLRKWFKFNLPTSIIAQIVLSLFPKTSNQSCGLSQWLSAFIYLRPSPKPCQAITRAQLSSAYEGGPRLEAGPCTSLNRTSRSVTKHFISTIKYACTSSNVGNGMGTGRDSPIHKLQNESLFIQNS